MTTPKFYVPTFLAVLLLMSCKSETKKSDVMLTEDASATTIVKDTVAPSETTVVLDPYVYGLDISKYQGDELQFLDSRKDSLSFVFIKATEGITYTDPKFANNWNTVEQKGYIRGAYHFYRTNDSPDAQAQHFVQTVGDLHDSDLPLVIDFEDGSISGTPTPGVDQVQNSLLSCLTQLEKMTNRKPMIYTDITTGNKYLNDPKFAAYPLWIANYRQGDAPHMPSAWQGQEWLFWQKSADYSIGQTSNDFDVFNGSIDDLRDFIRGSVIR